MNKKSWFVLVAIAGFALLGCDQIPGMGNEQQAPPMQAPPGMAPPAQPGVPVQPMPGQPAMVPPGAVPVQPVPGQPAAQPGMPAPAQPIPGQPAVPGTAVAPTPAAQPTEPPPPTGDVLIDRLNAEKTKVASDWIATSSMVRQRLNANSKQSFQVQLPGPPYCHTYLAVGDDTVTNLDLSVDSPTGIPEAKDSVEANVAAVQNHCPNVAGAFKLNVDMAKGEGEFAIQVYSKAR